MNVVRENSIVLPLDGRNIGTDFAKALQKVKEEGYKIDEIGSVQIEMPKVVSLQEAVRKEFEYEIPEDEAREMLDAHCEKPLIEKLRYMIQYKGLIWEVDEFSGENSGLVIAEIELESEDQEFERPEWVGREVSGDPRYYNVSLVRNPWTTWRSSWIAAHGFSAG